MPYFKGASLSKQATLIIAENFCDDVEYRKSCCHLLAGSLDQVPLIYLCLWLQDLHAKHASSWHDHGRQ